MPSRPMTLIADIDYAVDSPGWATHASATCWGVLVTKLVDSEVIVGAADRYCPVANGHRDRVAGQVDLLAFETAHRSIEN